MVSIIIVIVEIKDNNCMCYIFVAFAVNSGTTTVAVLIQALLNAGDSIVLPRDVYYGNYAL